MRRIIGLLLFLAISALAATGQAATQRVGSWSAFQQRVEPENASAPRDLHEAALRQTVHWSRGGNVIRLHVSNRFAATLLHVTAVYVAKPHSPSSSNTTVESEKTVTLSAHAGYAAIAEPVSLLRSLFSSADRELKIAFTFDDLPVHGPLPPGESRMEVISKIISALHAAGLPPTYGFINAVHLEGQPEHAAVLDAWRAAGNPLGNHTWSHINLDERPLDEVEQDTLRDEPTLEKLMKGEDWHWFRYPYLAEGGSLEKRAAFREFLRQHGYKVAAVTMSFGDYEWNGPYARCRAKGDAAEVKKLEDSYLKAAEESIDYYRSMSHTLYRRDIAYVLLMHIGAFDAEMLPRLLDLYRSKGFEFVSLPEAERDKFYRSSIDLSLPAKPDMLEEAMRARHLELPHHTDFAAELESVCR